MTAAANLSKVELAKQAIADGKTRGQFIQEHTGHLPSKPLETCLEACQKWSDAYSQAMEDSDGSR